MADGPARTSLPAPTLTAAAPSSLTSGRIMFALRQASLLGVALLVAGLVTERLRPDEALDRGFASTPFLWAIVLWYALLLFDAVAFEAPQTKVLERVPLYAALLVGTALFLTGLVTFDAGPVGRRLIYLFATSLGAVMFWWAIIGLGVLVTQRLRD